MAMIITGIETSMDAGDDHVDQMETNAGDGCVDQRKTDE